MLCGKELNSSRWEGGEDSLRKYRLEPAAVSWGPNRTDVFARGRRRDLIHTFEGR